MTTSSKPPDRSTEAPANPQQSLDGSQRAAQAASRPIIFSGAIVRAILEGRTTQTRRVCKESIDMGGSMAFAVCPAAESGWIAWFGQPHPNITEFTKKAYQHGFACPHGKPGDKLWVRETWQTIRSLTVDEQLQQATVLREFFDGKVPANEIVNKAKELPLGTGEPKALYAADFGEWAYDVDSDLKPWRPSIFMPRSASRITLEIISVRVERLQEISYEDEAAEGIVVDGTACNDRHSGFIALWNSINGKHPWELNPWVWVIEFRRVNA